MYQGFPFFAWCGLIGLVLSNPLAAQAPRPNAEKGEIPGKELPPPGPLKDLHGDPLPQHALFRLGTIRLRIGEYVPATTISPDGKFLALGTQRDSVHLIDPLTGKEVRRFFLQGQGLNGMAFTPDSKRIACVGYGTGIRLFDVDTGKLVQTLQTQQPNEKFNPSFRTSAFVFSADGKIMAAGNDGFGQDKTFVYAWDLTANKQLGPFSVMPNYNVRVALSPDGKKLASWGHYSPRNPGGGPMENNPEPARTIQIFDVAGAKEILKIKLDRPQVSAGAFSPDGTTLAIASGMASYHAFDAATGKELRRYVGRRGQASHLRFSPDGKRLFASTSEGIVQSWEAETGKRLSLAEGPARAPGTLAFPAKGSVMALSMFGQALYLWDATTGQSLVPTEGHQQRITALTFAGKEIITAGAEGKVCWWDQATGKELRSLLLKDDESWRYGGPPRLGAFAVSPDGRYITAGNDYGNAGLRLWELPSGRVVCDFEGPRSNSQMTGTFSPDGKYLAAGGFDGIVSIWEVDTGRELSPIKFKDIKGNQVGSDTIRVAFSTDAKSVAISDRSYDRNTGQPISDLLLWDVGKNKQVGQTLKMPQGQAGPVYSPDGRFIAVPAQRAVILLRAESGKEMRTLELGPTYYNLFTLAFSPDGRTLAVASQGGGYRTESSDIFVWELASGFQRHFFSGHTGPVQCLAFAPDGRSLASASADTTTLVWDLGGRLMDTVKNPVYSEADKNKLWTELGAARGEHGELCRKLLAAPQATLDLIKHKLHPVKSVKIDPTQIDKLITDLDHEQFNIRVKATRALEQLGDIAGPALVKAQQTQDKLEPRRRIDTLLEKLERTNLSAEELRAVRAIEILEQIGGIEARAILTNLADGAGHSRVTQDARKTLARMK